LNQAKALEMAGEIVALVNDLEKEFERQIQGSRGEIKSGWYMRHENYRNWNDTVVNALPTRSFTEALWADVFGVSIGRAPMMSSNRVDAFVDRWREVIAEWELIGNVGE
jgi:hypothetical protein